MVPRPLGWGPCPADADADGPARWLDVLLVPQDDGRWHQEDLPGGMLPGTLAGAGRPIPALNASQPGPWVTSA